MHKRSIQTKPKPKRINTNKHIVPLLAGATISIFAAAHILKTSTYPLVFENILQSTLSISSSELHVDAIGVSEIVRNTGSGFVLQTQNGKKYGITNNHVVEDALNVYVHAPNSKENIQQVQVIYHDALNDIAIFDISDIKHEKSLTLCTKDAKLGEHVWAFGDPFGLEGSISRGIISGVQRFKNGFLQTDAAINSGSSGGPLISEHSACVLGMNTAKSEDGSGVGFAIPANIIANILKKIST